MAKWMARKVGLLGTRLEVTQVPEEGRSVHEPVWSKVNLETLLDMVEHLNSKNETIKVLFNEIRDLKTANDRLTKAAYGRPLANGRFIHDKPINAMRGVVEDPGGYVPYDKKGIFGDYGIKQEGEMVTINAPDASNGEITENVRRAAASRPDYPGEIPISRDYSETRDSSSDNSSSTDSSSSPSSSD